MLFQMGRERRRLVDGGGGASLNWRVFIYFDDWVDWCAKQKSVSSLYRAYARVALENLL